MLWSEAGAKSVAKKPRGLCAGGAGAAIGVGARAIVLTNEKGAVLQLSGRQTGLMLNADLSGLAISLR